MSLVTKCDISLIEHLTNTSLPRWTESFMKTCVVLVLLINSPLSPSKAADTCHGLENHVWISVYKYRSVTFYNYITYQVVEAGPKLHIRHKVAFCTSCFGCTF